MLVNVGSHKSDRIVPSFSASYPLSDGSKVMFGYEFLKKSHVVREELDPCRFIGSNSKAVAPRARAKPVTSIKSNIVSVNKQMSENVVKSKY